MTEIADAHVHFFAGGYPGDQRWPAVAGTEIAAYEGIREKFGVSDALVVGYEGAAFAAGNNGYLRELAATRAWLHTTAYVGTDTTVTAGLARELLEAGHVGISLYATRREDVRAIAAWPSDFWSACDSAGAIISINAAPEAMDAFSGLPGAVPSCAFFFSHLGMPGRYSVAPSGAQAARRIDALLSMSRYSNCYVKVSGLYATCDPPTSYPQLSAAPFVRECLLAFGPRRLVWGSDFAPALEHITFDQCIEGGQLVGLPTANAEPIMGGNLRSLLAGERRWLPRNVRAGSQRGVR